MAVPAPDLTFQLLDGAQAAALAGELEALHDLILSNRREERATLTVLPTARAAQNAFQNWGWRKVARTRDPGPGSPVSDVLVTTLPVHYQP